MVIEEKCDFATRLFKRADEVLKSELNILKLKDDVANFDHVEHAELRKEIMKPAQGSSAQGSYAQGGSSARKRKQDETRKGLELLQAKVRGIKRRREKCINEKIALLQKIDSLNEEIAECDEQLADLAPIDLQPNQVL